MNRKQLKEELAKSEPPEIVWTHKTFCFYKDTNTGNWVVGELQFNPISGHVGRIEEVYSDFDRGVVEEHYRIKVATEVFNRE